MQEANARTVLGDFDDAIFEYNGVTSTFFRRDDTYWVRTDGPDGELTEYPVAYSFGVFPLQQYLIEFPGGRYQALSLSWDTRSASEGGQRWFHLYPDEIIDFQDPLHWTGIQQNWNYMCAECHTTDLRKGFDLASDSFTTTWAEIDVSCEACHGPGSRHVEWAKAPAAEKSRYAGDHLGLEVRLTDPGRGTWLINPETGNGLRMAPAVETQEIDTCARCHSRRSLVTEDYQFGRSSLDTHRLALLEEGLYHAGGQILEEVYVHGSFLQSRMYGQGVTCTDCHDAHTTQLHFPGDAVCFRCHSQAKFAVEEHHFHKPGTSGSFCVDCHMPSRNYMVVDPRHDHSLRIPRPDLSVRLATPDACSSCHDDKPVQWSADWVAKWYGPDRRAEYRYDEALAAGREGGPGATQELLRVIRDVEMPGIVRATALELFAGLGSPELASIIDSAVREPDPLIRLGAVRAMNGLPIQQRMRAALPLLSDPIRTLRVEAVRILITVPAESMSQQQRSLFLNGVEEYRRSQMANAERAEAHLNLGWLEASLGDLGEAEREYKLALERDPHFIPAYINLADLYREQNRDGEGEEQLRRALKLESEAAETHHSLGLLLVRQGRLEEALDSLERASELAPQEVRFAYVLGVALHDSGDRVGSLRVLEQALEVEPTDQGVLVALMTYYRELGDAARTLEYARRLLALDPANADLQRLVQQLEAGIG